MKKQAWLALLLVAALVIMALPVSAQGDAVELHITWYDDGNEGEVLRDLLDRFEAEHSNIKVVIDTVPYADLHTLLQAQVETGEAPDMARITFPARFLGSYLDLSQYVADPQYWLDNVPEAVLGSMRENADDTGVYGFPTQFTVTGPFINVTLFEQAGVEIPADDSTWEEWVAAATRGCRDSERQRVHDLPGGDRPYRSPLLGTVAQPLRDLYQRGRHVHGRYARLPLHGRDDHWLAQ